VTEDVRHRLFVAFEVREPARAALIAAVEPLRREYPGIRWADPELWHVTLEFIGGVPPDRAEEVDAAVAAVARRRGALELRLTGAVGTFGRFVLYAELDLSEELMETQAELCDRLEEHGFTPDRRPFTPHVTLGRAPRGTRVAPQLLARYRGPAVRWTTQQLLVVRSRLRVGGAVHEVRSAHGLTGAHAQDAAVH
jgi:RNA 2',3'-cyclic 3'-phosphodiesterase